MKIHAVLLAGTVWLGFGAAHAELQPPRPPTSFKSPPAVALFNKEVVNLYNDVNRGCAIAQAASAIAAIGRIEAEVAALTDADDQKRLTSWLAEMKPWVEKYKGVPGVGTWEEAKAKVAAAKTFTPGTLGDLTTDEGLDKSIADAIKVRNMAQAVVSSEEQLNKLQNCGDFFGPPLNNLRSSLSRATAEFETPIHEVAESLKNKHFHPLFAKVGELGRMKTSDWRGHATWVDAAITITNLSRTIVGMEKRLKSLAEYIGDEEEGPAAALAEARKQIAALDPLIVERVPEIGYPKVSARDPVRDKPVREVWASYKGKFVNGPHYEPKITQQSAEETDSVDHLRHKLVYQQSKGFLVWQPDKWSRPLPAGLDPKGMCELRWFERTKYSVAGPGHKKNVWIRQGEGTIAPMLCKNASTPTKLPME
jgi:hypothetical protein